LIVKQGSISFLKKRNKKLLNVAFGIDARCLAWVCAVRNKSFLVRFFKKELLSFCGGRL